MSVCVSSMRKNGLLNEVIIFVPGKVLANRERCPGNSGNSCRVYLVNGAFLWYVENVCVCVCNDFIEACDS